MKDKTITLLGASGYTGSLIAEKLNALNIKFSLAGRNAESLSQLRIKTGIDRPVHLVDITDPKQVDSLLEQSNILINCVGPFNLFGKILVEKCSQKKITYLDITGEQEIVKYSYENLNTIAKKSGATIAHSISFESCLADLLAERIIHKAITYKEISTYYQFERSRPSPGTKLTMKLSRFYPSYYLDNNELKCIRTFELKKNVEFKSLPEYSRALFMPYPEVIFFSRKYNVTDSASFLLMTEDEAAIAKNKSQPEKITFEDIINKHFRIKNHGPSETERRMQSFRLIVNAIQENNVQTNIMLNGVDMYGITAELMAYAVKNLIQTSVYKTGIISPGEIFNDFDVIDKIMSKYNMEIALNI